MPRVPFTSLPDAGRLWVFASDRPLTDADAAVLLAEVDRFLDRWQAHGAPLRSARDWRDDRFLAIGIDPTAEQASGCSIDGLFRELQRVQSELSTALLGGGRVFYRDRGGDVRVAPRAEAAALARNGVIGDSTPVFDTAVTDVSAWRSRFERPMRDSWARSLLPSSQASQSSSR